jgi:NADH-quinone oxidoreductase subunit L
MGKPRSEDVHPHESPFSMLAPLVILALLSICGGWIKFFGFPEFLAPAVGAQASEASVWRLLIPGTSYSLSLEIVLSIVAVLVALEGALIADKFYRRKLSRPATLVAAFPGGYKLLANKYFVDEFYGAVIVKPLLGFSKYILQWVIDFALVGGLTWLLGGIVTLAGTILQRWQSGNLRSYAAWLAAGAAAVLLFALVPWATAWPDSLNFIWKATGH